MANSWALSSQSNFWALALAGALASGCGGDADKPASEGGTAGTDAGGGGSGGSAGSAAGGQASGGSAGSVSNIYLDQIRAGDGQCLPRALVPNPPGTAGAGQVPCAIYELRFPAAACQCDPARGRADVSATRAAQVRQNAMNNGVCGTDGGLACEQACICELLQTAGSELDTCLTEEVVPQSVYGFCYVDPAAGFGVESLVADCPENQKRRLRFVGADTPAADGASFIGCTGPTLGGT